MIFKKFAIDPNRKLNVSVDESKTNEKHLMYTDNPCERRVNADSIKQRFSNKLSHGFAMLRDSALATYLTKQYWS